MSNQNNTLVSVVIPVYNVKEYLADCLDSVLIQTYKNIQIILVDDGSTDGCSEICRYYAQKDDRIEVVYKSNGGLSDARNAGIQKARGEYVTFVDSDDFVSNCYVENLLNLAILENCDIAITSFEIFKQNDKNLKHIKMREGLLLNKDDKIITYSKDECLQNILYCFSGLNPNAWRKIYKTKLFDNINFPKGKIYEDLATIPLLIDKVDKVAFCDKVDYFYNVRDSSISNSSELSDRRMQIFGIIDDLICYFKNRQNIINALNFHAIIVIFSFVSRQGKINQKNVNLLKKIIKDKIFSVLMDKKVRIRYKLSLCILHIFGFRVYKTAKKCFNFAKGKL